MASTSPKEYITLKSGRSNNFASYYDNIGKYSSKGRKKENHWVYASPIAENNVAWAWKHSRIEHASNS